MRLFDYADTVLSAGWAKTFEEHSAHGHREEPEHHGSHGHDHHHHDDNSAHYHHGHDHRDEGHNHLGEYGISTFTYYRRRPFVDVKLEAWVNQFPAGVVRCKGLVWIDDGEDVSHLLEQAGQSVTVSPFAHWLASAPQEEREQVWARDPVARENWNEECGDRMTKLVFIGMDMDEDGIAASLDACLLKGPER